MRILFVVLTYPLPANNGHKIRTWALLRALAAEGHDVSLLAFAREEEAVGDEAQVRSVCRDVEIVPVAGRSVVRGLDVRGRLTRLAARQPYVVARCASPALLGAIRARLRNERFDAIMCDIFTFPSVPSGGIPMLVNNENVEHVMLRRYIHHELNPAKRVYAWLEAMKMQRWECLVWRKSSVSLVCSEIDRRTVEALCPGVRTAIVPNVVDVDAYSPASDGEPGRVLFQGGMDYFPNQDAVSYFIGEILPRLRRLVPGVKFVVAGRNPSPVFVRRFSAVPDVEFTGTIPDMRAEIGRAAVCVVPLRIGSGTRLKILESAAMAKAIVSTTIGAEGLDFVEGQEMLLADTPAAFAAAAARLLREPWTRKVLGDRARQRVEARYSFATLRAGVRDALALARGEGARA